jgi:RNA polymerase sigma-32 factor
LNFLEFGPLHSYFYSVAASGDFPELAATDVTADRSDRLAHSGPVRVCVTPGPWLEKDDRKMANTYVNMESGLSRYIEEAKRFPMLDAEREKELALAWRGKRDGEALRLLIGSHLRLAVKIARGFGGYGLPLSDLVAEGNVGLMQAVEKFDPDRGFRFSTYAMWWIRAAIQEYILHSWSLVKIGTTAAQKKLFFNLRRLKGRMQELEQGDLSADAVRSIAEELQVSTGEVIEMNRRLAAVDSSLNASVGEEGETDRLSLLVDDQPNQETRVAEADERKKRRKLLVAAMEGLNERERRIVIERRLRDEPLTLEELSREFNVSRERVRQIEVRAFEKLQRAIVHANQANDNKALAAAAA